MTYATRDLSRRVQGIDICSQIDDNPNLGGHYLFLHRTETIDVID